MTIEDKLKIIRAFQAKYPGSHVGGSLGLLIQGIDLKRDLIKSDIDMTVQGEIDVNSVFELDNMEQSSNPEDFDYQFRHHPDGFGGPYVKIDINIQPNRKFNTVSYCGHEYRVSRIEEIIAWKHFYSMKGVGKHTDDLETIRTGIRPKETETKPIAASVGELDDLPF